MRLVNLSICSSVSDVLLCGCCCPTRLIQTPSFQGHCHHRNMIGQRRNTRVLDGQIQLLFALVGCEVSQQSHIGEVQAFAEVGKAFGSRCSQAPCLWNCDGPLQPGWLLDLRAQIVTHFKLQAGCLHSCLSTSQGSNYC